MSAAIAEDVVQWKVACAIYLMTASPTSYLPEGMEGWSFL